MRTNSVPMSNRTRLSSIILILMFIVMAINDCEDNPACEGPGDWRMSISKPTAIEGEN